MTGLFRTFAVVFARLYPWPVETSDALDETLFFLDWGLTPEQVVRAGYGAGLVVGAISFLGAVLAPRELRLLSTLVACAATVLCIHVVHSAPKVATAAKRTRALGAAPDLVARAVLRMRLTPTPERAAEFAAHSSEGVLSESLATHVRQTQNTATSGLITFGDDWADLFPSLRRSCSLILVAGRTGAADRTHLLERALSVVLDGTRTQLQSFAAWIRGPVTALYAFGVLLPTALVALVPAAGAAGVVVTPIGVVAVYNVLLPAILVAASVWLLVRRPVAFPPPDVTRTHPDVVDRRTLALVCGVATAVLGVAVALRLFPPWGAPVAAIGLGCGTTLLVANHPVVSVYGHVRDVEDGLSDVLELVGRRVANGRAVETALEQVAVELDGPMGDVLADGVRQQRQLHVGVREAFLGRYGVLHAVPSPRIRGSFALLSLAATEGRPAGTALLAFAEHVDDLQQIEQSARQQLATVCRTLSNTATLFGPMVAGSTVALADSIGSKEVLPGGAAGFDWLGGPVGIYVLGLAVILTVLSVGLVRGFDSSLVGYRVGRALVAATSLYLCSYLLVEGIL